MNHKLTKELDNIFETCSAESLSPKVTHLITYATHLVSCRCDAAQESFALAGSNGASMAELNRVACLCACTAGPMAQDNHLTVLRSAHRAGVPKGYLASEAIPLAAIGSSPATKEAYSLDGDIFNANRLCTVNSLDKKTTHLVALAACLATSCDCAAGHIVEARNAGASQEEIARAACIASCVCGLRVKYAFLSHLQSVEGCSACDCPLVE